MVMGTIFLGYAALIHSFACNIWPNPGCGLQEIQFPIIAVINGLVSLAFGIVAFCIRFASNTSSSNSNLSKATAC
jgi:hypothetical protein